MNSEFYKRCKNVVANLKLSYEQGIARDVILNELDCLEKQAEDYQKRFNKAIEYINKTNFLEKGYIKFMYELENILNGDDDNE